MNEFATWSVQDWESYQSKAESCRFERDSEARSDQRIYILEWPTWGRLIYRHEEAYKTKDGRIFAPATFGYFSDHANIYEQAVTRFLCGYGFDRTSYKVAPRGSAPASVL